MELCLGGRDGGPKRQASSLTNNHVFLCVAAVSILVAEHEREQEPHPSYPLHCSFLLVLVCPA